MIYDNIQRLCRERGVSIWRLEQECGIGNGVVGKWAQKTSAPRIDSIAKVAEYFGVTVDELTKEAKR